MTADNGGSPLVRVENVSRTFEVGNQTINALKDVSFDVTAGEFLAVIGRSGSGKTTLLNVIAGLDRASSGHVYIGGEDVSAMSDSQLTELRRHRLGFVFQSFGLLPLLSAYENVEIALRIAGAPIRERGRRSRELIELVGLERRSHHRPYELSGGEQQRVAIARALANKPTLILADEPTGELDSTTATQIFQLLLEVIDQEGVTVITTTHDRLVMEKARRVIELADGELQTGPTYFERDRKEAVAVPWKPPESWNAGERANPNGPDAPTDGDEAVKRGWRRPAPQERRAPYTPPPSPREPL
ncbi:MAG TPA: ABC transporter ATP-binding protein [Dehalococcoidia bacterium]|nr:ABC transporter ATP-binding protein [Dehalococcoidia bacterium]